MNSRHSNGKSTRLPMKKTRLNVSIRCERHTLRDKKQWARGVLIGTMTPRFLLLNRGISVMKKLISCVLALFLASAVQAQQSTAGLQYTYLQAQWSNVDFDDSVIDFDGIAAAASFKINDGFYVTGDHMRLSESGAHLERLSLAGGFRMPMSRVLDINVGAGLVDYDTDVFNKDDSGVQAFARVRGLIEPDWELSAGFLYEDAAISDTSFTFSAAYSFHRQVSVGIDTRNGDMDVTSLYVRFAF
jgi:hypothetical protein